MSVRKEFQSSNCLMFVVVATGVKKYFDVVLAAIATLEVRMLVCLSVLNEFQFFAMSIRNEFIC